MSSNLIPLSSSPAIFLDHELLDFSLQMTAKGSAMRGDEERQESMVMLASLDDRVPADHPLRPIRRMVDQALSAMSPLLASLYAERGRVLHLHHSQPPPLSGAASLVAATKRRMRDGPQESVRHPLQASRPDLRRAIFSGPRRARSPEAG